MKDFLSGTLVRFLGNRNLEHILFPNQVYYVERNMHNGNICLRGIRGEFNSDFFEEYHELD